MEKISCCIPFGLLDDMSRKVYPSKTQYHIVVLVTPIMCLLCRYFSSILKQRRNHSACYQELVMYNSSGDAYYSERCDAMPPSEQHIEEGRNMSLHEACEIIS